MKWRPEAVEAAAQAALTMFRDPFPMDRGDLLDSSLTAFVFFRAFDQHMTSMHIFFCKFCITVVDFGKKREILLDFLIKKARFAH